MNFLELVIVALFGAAIAFIVNAFLPFDVSPKSSVLEIVTDDLTGCQYLIAPLPSGITPRMHNGKHIGCKP